IHAAAPSALSCKRYRSVVSGDKPAAGHLLYRAVHPAPSVLSALQTSRPALAVSAPIRPPFATDQIRPSTPPTTTSARSTNQSSVIRALRGNLTPLPGHWQPSGRTTSSE